MCVNVINCQIDDHDKRFMSPDHRQAMPTVRKKASYQQQLSGFERRIRQKKKIRQTVMSYHHIYSENNIVILLCCTKQQ